mgnify:CR=1 FL=1
MQTVQRNPLERAIVAVCSLVLWLTTAVIFLILTANTVLRYVSGSSLQWANELPELLFPWLVMAGVVMAAEKARTSPRSSWWRRCHPPPVASLACSAGSSWPVCTPPWPGPRCP